MITVLMDYDGTLHDHDAVITRSIHGILDQPGHQLYHTWRYRIHRDIIHTQHLDRHDDMPFHAQLLFQHLQTPYHHPTATNLTQAAQIILNHTPQQGGGGGHTSDREYNAIRQKEPKYRSNTIRFSTKTCS